jgi:hypothetical protein
MTRTFKHTCACGKPASCIGAYEGAEEYSLACDACCFHGNEDGHCEQLSEIDNKKLNRLLAERPN